MRGDYGTMEGKDAARPYNLRLLSRLAVYAKPRRAVILVAICLAGLLTLLDLTVPYLAKVAIDRYIVATWYPVHPPASTVATEARILKRYREFLTPAPGQDAWFISNIKLKKMDPGDQTLLRAAGVVGTEPFYRVAGESSRALGEGNPDEPRFVAVKSLRGQPAARLMEVRGQDLRGVTLVGLLLLAFLGCAFALGYVEHYLLEYTGQHIMLDLRMALFEQMQQQGIRFFDKQRVGRLVTRVTNDVENLNEMFKSVLVTAIRDLLLLLGILCVLLYLSPRLALVCFTLLPVIFGLTFLFSTLAREAFRDLRKAVARLNVFLQERVSGMRVIQLYVREAVQMKRFAKRNSDHFLAGMRQVRVFALFMPIMELCSSIAVALLIWYGGGQVLQDRMTLGALVAFISYMQMFFKPVRNLAEKYNVMQSAMASLERIFAYMDMDERLPDHVSPRGRDPMEGRLVFRNVSFSYESGEPVLRDISFEAEPGQVIAVVGPTGAGKTTLIHLVERFYDPDQGTITCDGIDLREWDLEAYRKQVALVMQEVFLFAGTLQENITLGREGLGEEEALSAAAKANARGFIDRSPEGLSQEAGEGGVSLSAGERQLLSMARALAGRPRLLILDEATSSVDPETERLIQEALSRITTQRTTLVVAHRLSTIRNAHRILFLHKGRIQEQGTHEELMNLGGLYYRMTLLREESEGRN